MIEYLIYPFSTSRIVVGRIGKVLNPPARYEVILTSLLALKGSEHLDFILDHRLFQPVSNPEIEALLDRVAPGKQDKFEFVTRSQVEEGDLKKEELVLTAGSHVDVSSTLEVPELSGEVERAVWQVEREFVAAEKNREEKRQLQSQQPPADEKHEERK